MDTSTAPFLPAHILLTTQPLYHPAPKATKEQTFGQDVFYDGKTKHVVDVIVGFLKSESPGEREVGLTKIPAICVWNFEIPPFTSLQQDRCKLKSERS